MVRAKIGIIGGSGLYEMDELQDRQEVNIETPFGEASDAYLLGTINGREVAFLSRHGRRFKGNRRMALQMKNVERKKPGELEAIRRHAKELRRRIDAGERI